MGSATTLLEVHEIAPPRDADALFREARQRRRRRRLVWLGFVVIVIGTIAATVASNATRPPRPTRPPFVSTAAASKWSGLPVGPAVVPERAGSLAVGPSGALFVVDVARHEVLVHEPNGQFRVVAGDGRAGFGGDGGPATKARLSDVSDMAFAPNGDLYLADGGRVRVVGHDGVIRTIAGDGQSNGTAVDGEPALAAALGPQVSVAFGPGGQLYLATLRQILRLSPADTVAVVPARVTSGPRAGALGDFGRIAVDAQGDIYASSLYTGWSVYEISPDGVATSLGYDRRSGGNVADMERGVDGVILADNGSDVVRPQGDRLVTSFSFGKVPGISTFVFLQFFALAPHGILYADDLGPPAFESYQQIVSVEHGHGTSLWRGRNRRVHPPRKSARRDNGG